MAASKLSLGDKPLCRLISVNRDGTDGKIQTILEESVDLGRVEGALLYQDDPYLSNRHCRLFIKNDRWHIQDLDSLNGVFIRLNPGHSHELQPGDRIFLGKQLLIFEQLLDAEHEMGPAVENGVLVFGSPMTIPWGRLRQFTVGGITRDVYHLFRQRIIIGREDGEIIFPDDEFMSRSHLALLKKGNKVFLQDLESSNGTYIRIRSLNILNSGDMIRIGDQLLRFELI
jgi:pSer/pThr/pTyr-binding forkhead associated (FHA) protein